MDHLDPAQSMTRKTSPYSVELLDALEDRLDRTRNKSRCYSGDIIEEVDEELEVLQLYGDSDNRRASAGDISQSVAACEAEGGAPNRLMQRPRRPNRERAYSVSEGGKFAGTSSANGAAKLSKNSRKSRNRFGRGLPKKGGGGGKGTWGKPGCELEPPWVDPNDPNYDSDEQDQNASLEVLVPELSEHDILKMLEPLFREYFEHGETSEVQFTLQEMLPNFGVRRWMIVTLLIEMAMDHKPSHREMTSTLISDLYLKVITQRDLGKAFDHLLRQLPDLVLDTPDAVDILGNFIARAIADDCIPPKFIISYKGHVEDEDARSALQRAQNLLSMKHGLVRLDNVWGVGGGIRPVKYLVKKIRLLLKEYLCSGDLKEATRCLLELEVPHFHHELVYRGILMVVEAMHTKTEEAMTKLLKHLFDTFVVSIDQMKVGFERIYDSLPDLAIDVPAAYSILERFVVMSRKASYIDDETVRKLPNRGRKRFVSEGDGGKLKVDIDW